MSEPKSNPEDDPSLLDLAASVSAGNAVDWQAAEDGAGAGRGPVVRALKLIAKIAEVHRSLQRTVILKEKGAAGAGEHDAGPPVPGRWGHLELLERVGEGASADVYRARDTRLEREVALKLLYRSPHRGETGNEAVLREGRLLARVRHPNVATVYGADEHDGRVGVWMEFVRGKPLNRLLAEQGPLGAREASLIGIDLCRALAAVHEKGVVHRDLKAQNVMREEGGRILLVDFGIGRDLAAEDEGAPSLSGTPLYLAPETFAGGPATVQSDLYSLGVLLFHLVTGKFPVVGGSLADLRQAHGEGRAALLRDLRPDLPGWFVQAVEKALERDPAARFASAGQMERALGQMSGTWNRVAEGAGEAQPAQPADLRLGRWLGLGLGALALLVLAFVLWKPSGSPRSSVEEQARQLYLQADERYGRDDYEGALDLAKQSISLDPSSPQTWDLLATLHGAAGRVEEEGQASDSAFINIDRAFSDRSRLLGNHYLRQLDYKEAARYFEEALAKDTSDERSRRRLAMIEARLGKPSKTVERLGPSCSAEQRDWISCGEFFIALAQTEGPAVARERFDAFTTTTAEAGQNLSWASGLIFLASGDLDRAQAIFVEQAAAAPDAYASEASFFLSQLEVLRGRLGEARQALETGFAVDRRSSQVEGEWRRLLALVELDYRLGDLPGAAHLLDQISGVPLRPRAARTLHRQALLEVGLGRRGRAEKLHQQLEDLHRQHDGNDTLAALALHVGGRLALTLKRGEEAVLSLETARRSREEPLILDDLAAAYESRRRYREALVIRQQLDRSKVALLNEDLALLWVLNLFELARDYERLGQTPVAVERYQQFLSLWGQDASDLPVVEQAQAALAKLTPR